ncbi:hypothetical protein GXW82_43985 [Streptacidiphilus sp. 4-A2]|nr:hypothetical protein [Streptacidiphilus sp. 4-A2]
MIVNLGASFAGLPPDAGPERDAALAFATGGSWTPFHARSQRETVFDPSRVGALVGAYRGSPSKSPT